MTAVNLKPWDKLLFRYKLERMFEDGTSGLLFSSQVTQPKQTPQGRPGQSEQSRLSEHIKYY